LAKHGFVLQQITFPVGERTSVEVHVRPGVVAKLKARIAPVFEHGGRGRLVLDRDTIHEPIDWGQVRFLHGVDQLAADFEAGFSQRQSAVDGQIVPGEGDLLCFRSADWRESGNRGHDDA
jgi:hypothetical protein